MRSTIFKTLLFTSELGSNTKIEKAEILRGQYGESTLGYFPDPRTWGVFLGVRF